MSHLYGLLGHLLAGAVWTSLGQADVLAAQGSEDTQAVVTIVCAMVVLAREREKERESEETPATQGIQECRYHVSSAPAAEGKRSVSDDDNEFELGDFDLSQVMWP